MRLILLDQQFLVYLSDGGTRHLLFFQRHIFICKYAELTHQHVLHLLCYPVKIISDGISFCKAYQHSVVDILFVTHTTARNTARHYAVQLLKRFFDFKAGYVHTVYYDDILVSSCNDYLAVNDRCKVARIEPAALNKAFAVLFIVSEISSIYSFTRN